MKNNHWEMTVLCGGLDSCFGLGIEYSWLLAFTSCAITMINLPPTVFMYTFYGISDI